MKVLAENRKAYFEYFIENKFEAGLALIGSEVKSLRNESVSLVDTYVQIKNGEAFAVNMFIGRYDKNNLEKTDERRTRKLLLHKTEIFKLERAVKEKGYSIIPLKIYFSGKHAKLEIALAKGKKLYDKKRTIQERDLKREALREAK